MKWSLGHEGEDLVRLKLGGELTLETAVELRGALQQALNAASEVVVELDGSAEADLSCLQLLCSAHRTALSAGRKLTLGTERPEQFRDLANSAGLCRQQGCTLCPYTGCVLTGGQQ